jgi:hypothetical protein
MPQRHEVPKVPGGEENEKIFLVSLRLRGEVDVFDRASRSISHDSKHILITITSIPELTEGISP